MAAHEDTIFALATAPGRAGVAILRVSGPRAEAIAAQLAGPLPEPRMATLRTFKDSDKDQIDRGLILWFPAPHSFTGEPVVEFHIHSGRAVVERMILALSRYPDTRAALAGEFTRRAFENGKLDLTEVEGLADLVAAETEAQRRQALRQMEGHLGAIYESWRTRLLQALAHLEAEIDFSDEELPGGMREAAFVTIAELSREIMDHLADGGRGEILRRGFRIAILGAPNAGKSSLLNVLAKREAAIVTSRAGTTRDVIEVHLDLGGYLVSLADTAGLRRTEDEIEAEGIRRSMQQAESADLKLLVFDAGLWPERNIETLQWGNDGASLYVLNKIDLMPQIAKDAAAQDYIPVSVLTGAGVDQLLHCINKAVTAKLGGGEAPGLTRERHRRELTLCVSNLDLATQQGKAVELVAEDVRLAVRALGRITGRAEVEDMLDILFGEFCIGK